MYSKSSPRAQGLLLLLALWGGAIMIGAGIHYGVPVLVSGLRWLDHEFGLVAWLSVRQHQDIAVLLIPIIFGLLLGLGISYVEGRKGRRRTLT